MDLSKLPGRPPDSQLARLILDGHPYDIFIILVHGKKGAGKTVFAIRELWEIYEALGYSEDDAYAKALDQLVFKPEDFLAKVDGVQTRIRDAGTIRDMMDAQEVALIVDDAGVGLSGELYRRDHKLYYDLLDTWQVLREYATAVFLTTPTPEKVPDAFAAYEYRVKVRPTGEGRWETEARIYPEETDAIGRQSLVTSKGSWRETFSRYLPNKWYLPYKRRRSRFRAYIKEIRGGQAAG